ncbi:MAG: TetR/AcrR family transcriptional regulator [Candidatus Thorarchaeota archaeon]
MIKKNGKSPKKRRMEQERKIRRESIITAAEKEFIETGYESSMVEQIAIEAGYTKATIYNYFDSKEDLLAAVIARTYQYLYDALENSLRDLGTKSQLRTVGDGYLKFAYEYPGQAALLNSGRCGMISMRILEKNNREESLTESEIEYKEKEGLVAELMMGVISQTLQESGLEGKVDPMRIMLALSAINSATLELIRRGAVGGQPKDVVKETLWVLFNIIEQGVKHYDEK